MNINDYGSWPIKKTSGLEDINNVKVGSQVSDVLESKNTKVSTKYIDLMKAKLDLMRLLKKICKIKKL